MVQPQHKLQPFACERMGALPQMLACGGLQGIHQSGPDVDHRSIEIQRGRIGRGRLIELVQVAERVAEIGMRVDQSGGAVQCAPDQRDRLLRLATPALHHAEQMQGVRIVRIACEHGTVVRLRHIEAARAMGVHGRLKYGKCVKVCRVHVGLVAPTACHL